MSYPLVTAGINKGGHAAPPCHPAVGLAQPLRCLLPPGSTPGQPGQDPAPKSALTHPNGDGVAGPSQWQTEWQEGNSVCTEISNFQAISEPTGCGSSSPRCYPSPEEGAPAPAAFTAAIPGRDRLWAGVSPIFPSSKRKHSSPGISPPPWPHLRLVFHWPSAAIPQLICAPADQVYLQPVPLS